MATLVTLEILVDSDNESEIADGLNDMPRNAQSPVDPDNPDARSWVKDWRLGYCGGNLRLQDIPASVQDAIDKDTYSEGDAFPSSSVPLHPGLKYDLVASAPEAMDSLWISVPAHCSKGEGGDLSVLLKRTHEGVIIDVWPDSQEDASSPLCSAAALFADAPAPEEHAA